MDLTKFFTLLNMVFTVACKLKKIFGPTPDKDADETQTVEPENFSEDVQEKHRHS